MGYEYSIFFTNPPELEDFLEKVRLLDFFVEEKNQFLIFKESPTDWESARIYRESQNIIYVYLACRGIPTAREFYNKLKDKNVVLSEVDDDNASFLPLTEIYS